MLTQPRLELQQDWLIAVPSLGFGVFLVGLVLFFMFFFCWGWGWAGKLLGLLISFFSGCFRKKVPCVELFLLCFEVPQTTNNLTVTTSPRSNLVVLRSVGCPSNLGLQDMFLKKRGSVWEHKSTQLNIP